MLKKILCYFLIVALVLIVGNVQVVLPVAATYIGNLADKAYSTASNNSDFVDDHVIVILNNAASLEPHSYTLSDFPEISCKSIEDFSTAKGAKVQAVLRGKKSVVANIDIPIMAQNINVSEFRKILCLKLENPGKGNVLRAVKALEQRSDVYYAGPDYILPCGPVLPDASADIGWGFEAIELSNAHQIETGSNAVKVGIVDSGIDASHPSLQSRVSTSLSRNFVNDSYSATADPLGHGTHIAGIIGGVGNNSLGIDGICQNITLVSLRVINTLQQTTAGIIAAAINHAEEKNIPILNLSLDTNSIGQTTLLQALANYSGLVVCSAGNHNVNVDLSGVNPGTLDYDNIICVGSSTQGNVKASISNYGQESVDLFAPGDSISSCFPRSLCSSSNCTHSGHISYGYHYMSGTSMASPMVAGAAALMLSADGSLTCNEIKTLILDNVKAYSSLSNLCVSGGVLNVKNIFSLHSMHVKHKYYVAVSANRHQRCCYKCSSVVLEPHVWDSMGGCLLCSYSN